MARFVLFGTPGGDDTIVNVDQIVSIDQVGDSTQEGQSDVCRLFFAAPIWADDDDSGQRYIDVVGCLFDVGQILWHLTPAARTTQGAPGGPSMSETWRVGQRRSLGLVDVREGGPEGGSRFVCEATLEDAERIVTAVNEVERLRTENLDMREALGACVDALEGVMGGSASAADLWAAMATAVSRANKACSTAQPIGAALAPRAAGEGE